MEKINALILGFIVLLAAGCESEKSEELAQPQAVSCKLTKVTWDDITPPTPEIMYYDSLGRFSGNGGGSSGAYSRLKYNAAGQVAEHRVYDRSNRLGYFALFSYDARGLLTKVAEIEQKPFSQVIDTLGYSFYKYDASNRLSTVTRETRVPYTSIWVDSAFYLPGNGIRFKKYLLPTGGGVTLMRTVEYYFDTYKNAYAQARRFYFADVSEGDLLPTEHNIASIKSIHHTQALTVFTSFVYEYNSAGYPVKWTQYNSLYSGVYYSGTYEYNCQ